MTSSIPSNSNYEASQASQTSSQTHSQFVEVPQLTFPQISTVSTTNPAPLTFNAKVLNENIPPEALQVINQAEFFSGTGRINWAFTMYKTAFREFTDPKLKIDFATRGARLYYTAYEDTPDATYLQEAKHLLEEALQFKVAPEYEQHIKSEADGLLKTISDLLYTRFRVALENVREVTKEGKFDEGIKQLSQEFGSSHYNANAKFQIALIYLSNFHVESYLYLAIQSLKEASSFELENMKYHKLEKSFLLCDIELELADCYRLLANYGEAENYLTFNYQLLLEKYDKASNNDETSKIREKLGKTCLYQGRVYSDQRNSKAVDSLNLALSLNSDKLRLAEIHGELAMFYTAVYSGEQALYHLSRMFAYVNHCVDIKPSDRDYACLLFDNLNNMLKQYPQKREFNQQARKTLKAHYKWTLKKE